MLGATPWAATPYIMALRPPVRRSLAASAPALFSALNLGCLALKALSLALLTWVFRLAPAPGPTPSDFTLGLHLI